MEKLKSYQLLEKLTNLNSKAITTLIQKDIEEYKKKYNNSEIHALFPYIETFIKANDFYFKMSDDEFIEVLFCKDDDLDCHYQDYRFRVFNKTKKIMISLYYYDDYQYLYVTRYHLLRGDTMEDCLKGKFLEKHCFQEREIHFLSFINCEENQTINDPICYHHEENKYDISKFLVPIFKSVKFLEPFCSFLFKGVLYFAHTAIHDNLYNYKFEFSRYFRVKFWRGSLGDFGNEDIQMNSYNDKKKSTITLKLKETPELYQLFKKYLCEAIRMIAERTIAMVENKPWIKCDAKILNPKDYEEELETVEPLTKRLKVEES